MISSGAAAQDEPRQRPATTPNTVAIERVSIDFRLSDNAYRLSYNAIARAQVYHRIFSQAGVTIDWRDRDAAREVISGAHTGTLDTIAGELLAGRNFVATYEPLNGVPRMSHLVVLGASGNASAVAPIGIDASGASIPAHPAPDREACGGAAALLGPGEPFISAAVSASAGKAGPTGRGQIVLADSRVLVAGGVDGCTGRASDAAELIDQSSGAVTPTGRMRTARYQFQMQKLPSGDVLAIGGKTGSGIAGATDKVERYEISTGQWKPAGLLASRRSGGAACLLDDGTVLSVGADDPRLARTAEVFDPVGQTAIATGSPSHAHTRGVKALTLKDGRCLVASSGPGGNLDLYDAGRREFIPIPVPGELARSVSTVFQMDELPDGTVLVVAERSFVLDLASGRVRPLP